MTQQEKYRIFVGAFPLGALAAQIQALREEYDPVTARITAPHVTLAGTYWRTGAAIVDSETETIARLQTLQTELHSFNLELGGIAAFPPVERPVIYLQVVATPALIAVRSALLRSLGPDKHRRFTPHLTLAMRLKGPRARQMLTQLEQSTWHTEPSSAPIERLALMQRGIADPAWREIATIQLQTS
jgi:2'-5' RNA ligase